MLFPFPLVAQNYSHSHGNPMGIPCEWEFPFPWTLLSRTTSHRYNTTAQTQKVHKAYLLTYLLTYVLTRCVRTRIRIQ